MTPYVVPEHLAGADLWTRDAHEHVPSPITVGRCVICGADLDG